MPPATIVIIRHSERVDHVDHTWGKTAARPHDSPLTSNGLDWSRRAGQYIAGLLSKLPPPPSATAAAPASSVNPDASSDAVGVDPHHRHLVNSAIVLSSPLVRTVETSRELCAGFEGALLKQKQQQVPPQQQQQDDDDGDQASTNKNNNSSGHIIKIVPERAMLEPAYWISYDIQKAGYSAAKPYGGAPLLSLDDLAQVSPTRLVVDRAQFHTLREVNFARCPDSGGFVENEDVRIRFRFAAEKLLFQTPALDGKTVFLVGHGASTVQMYNALARALQQPELLMDHNFSPWYTAFAVLVAVNRGGNSNVSATSQQQEQQQPLPFAYVNLVRPFCSPPHLQHVLGDGDDADDAGDRVFNEALAMIDTQGRYGATPSRA